MRLTAILLLAGCLQVSAAGYGQSVTLSYSDAPLTKIFRAIKKQTGYFFFYNARLMQLSHNVDINVKDVPLRQVLDDCFKDQPLTYDIINQTIVISVRNESPPSPPARDSTPALIAVRGRVEEAATGKPVEGASILMKGTAMGVSSGKGGLFEISVKTGATLEISYIGFETRSLVISDHQTGFLVIKLSPDLNKQAMTNVVVTGYQVINKESFTGNAITISGADLKKVNPQNVLESIETFDPSFRITDNNLVGSNPNSLPNINVRGSTALPSGSGDVLSRNNLASNVNLPTFILDGYEVSLEKVYDLDINRIQSVTLLKDAAATAVYGSRAANGVLVITTKAPQEGKLQLTYNYELNVTGPDLSDYHVLNAAQKLDYEKLAGLYQPVGGINQDEQDIRYYQKYKNVVSGVNTYWLSQPLRTTFGHKHSLYIEGGSPSVRYGINLLYQTAPGVMKGSYRNRYGLGMDLSYHPNEVFLFKNSLSVTQVKSQESPYGDFSSYVRMNPYYPKTDSAGHIIQAVDNWLIDTHQSGSSQYQTDVVLNPLYDATLSSFNKSTYLELIDAFSAEWNIARGLRLRSLLSFTKRTASTDDFKSPLSNEFYFYSTADLDKRGRYSYAADDEFVFDGNTTLTFNRQLGNQFINLALGANVRTDATDSKSFTAIGFTNDRFTNIGFASGYQDGSAPGGDREKDRLFGSFLSLNYSFRNKYLLDLSVRADGSSKFGTDKKVAPFWALGIGWNAHKEPFLDNSVISQLKLRASTGLTGSVSFPPYLAQTTYTYYRSNWYSTGVGATVNNYGNESLEWQRTQNYDVGMDLGLFKNRIVLSPRYYYKRTHGLLSDIVLPPSTGFGSYTDNLGDMENQGIELNLKYMAIQNRKWTLSLYANMVHNSNKILKISNALKQYNDKADEQQQTSTYQAVPLLRYKEGQSLNTIYAVRSLGIDPENGKEIFIRKDGSHTYTWDVRDIVPVADFTPEIEGYFGCNISYKSFLLTTSFYCRMGGKDYNQTLVDRVENADPRYNVDARVLSDRWKKPGDQAFFKDIADLGTTYASDRFVQKDNVLEIRSVYLSYDVSPVFYHKLAMKSLRLAFTMNDVSHWSTMKIERGIDYPFARSFTFSIQTGF